MARPSDAKNLDIDFSGSQNFPLIVLAVGKDFRTGNATIRHMNILFWNVDVIEKLYLHEVAVTLRVLRCQPVVFV